MTQLIQKDSLLAIQKNLAQANQSFEENYPGKSPLRQPVHTVYGGAQLFKADTAVKIARLARRSLEQFAPNFVMFAKALGLEGAETLPDDSREVSDLTDSLGGREPSAAQFPLWLAWRVYHQVCKKLECEAVEDFRIDYEDGFGFRPDEEEDFVAVQGAREAALGLKNGTLPPFIGIRIKPFNCEFNERGIRTLDLFLGTLLAQTEGQLPSGFVVTLPKVEIPEQARALVKLFESMERSGGLAPGSLKMEVMVETTQSVFDCDGRVTARQIANVAEGRCIGAHFGTYDYTASCDLIAAYQAMDNPVCDFARHVMKVAFLAAPESFSRMARRHHAGWTTSRRKPVADAGAGKPRDGASGVAAGLHPHSQLAASRLLPGLGSARGPAPGALCRFCRLLSRTVAGLHHETPEPCRASLQANRQRRRL